MIGREMQYPVRWVVGVPWRGVNGKGIPGIPRREVPPVRIPPREVHRAVAVAGAERSYYLKTTGGESTSAGITPLKMGLLLTPSRYRGLHLPELARILVMPFTLTGYLFNVILG